MPDLFTTLGLSDKDLHISRRSAEKLLPPIGWQFVAVLLGGRTYHLETFEFGFTEADRTNTFTFSAASSTSMVESNR